MRSLLALLLLTLLAVLFYPASQEAKSEQKYLYVAEPGIRNYTEMVESAFLFSTSTTITNSSNAFRPGIGKRGRWPKM